MDTRVQANNPEIFFFSSFLASVGMVYIVKGVKGVCKISFPHTTDENFVCTFIKNTSHYLRQTGANIEILRNDSVLKHETDILKAYFGGKQVVFNFPLDLSRGTPFQKKVWAKLMEIPYGECRSYKWVAEQIGHHRAYRVVGLANNKNPLPPVIPCHRVIGSDGKLTGYASGVHIKKQLLEMECNAVNKDIS